MEPYTYEQPVAQQVEHDGRGGPEGLVPHGRKVLEVRVHPALVIRVDDPHLLAEHGFGGDEDGVEAEESGRKEQEPLVRWRVFALTREHEADCHKVQYELDA